MIHSHPDTASPVPAAAIDDAPRYRSAAVARMTRMPVATLRVWERRYRVTMPALTASGQRLYTTADVRRLSLIRQLTDLGHAIGALATLDLAQLQGVAATHFSAGADTVGMDQPGAIPVHVGRPWRVAVVGSALARRLQNPALLRQLGTVVQGLGPFNDLAHAAQTVERSQVDALLVHAPTLNPGWLADFDAAAPGLRALPTAVLYGFAADTVCAELAAGGVALMREPQNDTVLGQWLRHLSSLALPHAPPPASTPTALAPAPRRRWDDATLAALAEMPTTVACECPRHIADLLLQLTRFEAYSDECENRNAVDAALHAYLGQVAAMARSQFETALDRVAALEGVPLPLE